MNTLLKCGVFLGVGGYVLANSMFSVQSGQRALVANTLMGDKDKVYSEGIHFKTPWEKPVRFDIRPHPYFAEKHFTSRDQKMVRIEVRAFAHPLVEHLPTINKQVPGGFELCEMFLPSIAERALYHVGSSFNSDELTTKKEILRGEILKTLAKSASKHHIGVDDVSITSIIVYGG